MSSYIYKTSLPDGRFYIGRHTWKDPGKDTSYFGSGIIVTRYARAYGRDSLSNEIICHVEDEQYVNDIEKLFVYEAKKDPLCVNISDGGVGWTKTCHPDVSGENNPMYGRNAFADMSLEKYERVTQKMSENSAMADPTRRWWKTKTQEEIQEIRSRMHKNFGDTSGENNPMYGRRGKDCPNYGLKRQRFKWLLPDGTIEIRAKVHQKTYIKNGWICLGEAD